MKKDGNMVLNQPLRDILPENPPFFKGVWNSLLRINRQMDKQKIKEKKKKTNKKKEKKRKD